MKVYTHTTALVALLLAAGVSVQAQSTGNSAAAAAAPLKVGTLNVRQAIVNTAEGKQASAELQSKFAPRQNELEGLRKEIEDLQNRLRACDRTCSDDEKVRLQRQGEVKTRQFDRKQNELQDDLNADQGDIVDRIGRKMIDVLERYSRENGFSVVFDTSAQNTPVIYASSGTDVTQDIIRLYDQAHPVKGGAAAVPAQPRPAPGTAKPPTQPPAQKPPAKQPQ